MTTTYNINELLEKKKMLEEQIREKSVIDSESMTYREETIIDHTQPKNTRSIIPRQKLSLSQYTQEYFGRIDELKKTKIAVQKYNAEEILGILQERDSIRRKHKYLSELKTRVLTETKQGRKITRQDKDGLALESIDIKLEPMFKGDEVEKLMDELAAQERKVNTEIQKLNLNAEISL